MNAGTGRRALTGCRTSVERDARGTGLVLWDTSTTPWHILDEMACHNPTFAVASPVAGSFYCVHGDSSEVSHVRISADQKLSEVSTRQTQGTNPVHLSVSADGNWLLVVNHSGSIVSLPIAADGSLGEVVGLLEVEGTRGPHDDQTGAKPHHVVQLPGSDRHLVSCKGADALVTVELDPATGQVTETSRCATRQASGPRHAAVNRRGDVAYTVDELSCTVSVLSIDEDGRCRLRQVHSTLPTSDVRDHRGAEIVLGGDGRTLYASNRSGAGDRTPGGPEPDTIAVFRIDDQGMLSPDGHLDSGGVRPRFFTEDDGQLVVALERSDAVMRIDPAGAAATILARTGSPVFLMFLDPAQELRP